MIRVIVRGGAESNALVGELYNAVRMETRVWSMSDLRRTRNLVLRHTSGRVEGTIRRVKASDAEMLEFECKAKDGVNP